MMGKSVVFICGIHGSGKTTLCDKISKYYNIPSYSSSDLIKEMKSGISFSSDKRVSKIVENQDILIHAVTRKLEENTKIILDGHMTLLNIHGEITPLATSVFEQLHISQIIFLNTPAEEICHRIFLRDKKHIEISNVNLHIQKEFEHANYISNELKIQLISFSGNFETDWTTLKAKLSI